MSTHQQPKSEFLDVFINCEGTLNPYKKGVDHGVKRKYANEPKLTVNVDMDDEPGTPTKKKNAFTKEESLAIINYYESLTKMPDIQKLLPHRAPSSIRDRTKKLFKQWKETI